MVLVWVLVALPVVAQERNAFPVSDFPPPPPEPNELEIEVPRGGPVWITLSAYSITSPVLRYRIKRPAKAGKLGTPELVTAETGRVKYRPPAGTGPGEDSFSYQVQSKEGVSAPAEVHITITDKDPVLITPNDVEFGELLPGESAKRSLELQNIGGGMAEGSLQVPDGWRLEGDPAYHMGAGETQTFTLTFKAAEVGRYTGDIEYSANPERATDLNVEVVAPIAVTSGTVELREAGEMRIGTIHVENRTEGERTLQVKTGPRLDADGKVTVPAKGAADILVRAKGGDGEVEDRVTVEGEGFEAEVPVHAMAAQGRDQRTEAMAPVKPVAAGPGSPVQKAQVAVAPAPAPPTPATAAPEETPASADAGLPGMDLPPLAEAAATPASVGRQVWALGRGKVTETEAVVGCIFKGAPPARSYRLELQKVGLDAQGRPVAQWEPFTRAMLQEKGPLVVAQMVNLQPGRMYVVRLVGLDDQGNVIESSSVGAVWTMPAKRGWAWGWVGAAVVAMAGAGFWMWRRRVESGDWT
jgi:hypothetical protein